jgi:hypothetical protein
MPRVSTARIAADTCVPYVGSVATVRDGGRRAASAGRSRHGEHPSARVSVAEMLIGQACQQPRFAVSDIRCSRRMTRVTGWPGSGRRLACSSVVAGPGAGCSPRLQIRGEYAVSCLIFTFYEHCWVWRGSCRGWCQGRCRGRRCRCATREMGRAGFRWTGCCWRISRARRRGGCSGRGTVRPICRAVTGRPPREGMSFMRASWSWPGCCWPTSTRRSPRSMRSRACWPAWPGGGRGAMCRISARLAWRHGARGQRQAR